MKMLSFEKSSQKMDSHMKIDISFKMSDFSWWDFLVCNSIGKIFVSERVDK